MTKKARLPMGMEDFERIRREEFYYIDKTKMIKDLLEHMAYVNLFTRPRRFGKTLNMSMLKYFFEIGCDKTLFDGLAISNEPELCEKYMGKFPVISISLKNVEGDNFDKAKGMFCSLIGREAIRFSFLAESNALTETEQAQFKKLIKLDQWGEFTMSDRLLQNSLLLLSEFLYKHYGQKTIILIDEYDVPLDKAYQYGYYDDMVNLVRNLFGQALKTNSSLYLAVLTGCLRISRESIFTGFNNFNVYTIRDDAYHEYFGFSDREVLELLKYYDFMDKYDTIKEWYDGYRFGSLDIYCPWDVISYCHALKITPSVKPQNYWVNTSSNSIIKQFVGRATSAVRNDLELLLNGGSIKKQLRQELTYRDLNSKTDNLWSLLFTTGYLTQCRETDTGLTELVIPNREIRWIFAEQIREWFEEESLKN